MSTRDEAQSSRRDQRNQPSRLTRSRRLRWLGLDELGDVDWLDGDVPILRHLAEAVSPTGTIGIE